MDENYLKHMDKAFVNQLDKVSYILYKTAFVFHMKYTKNATAESAHLVGLIKLEDTGKLLKELKNPQRYIDLSTGKTFYAIEQ